ncbi:MAG: hypothetical protein ACSHX9_09040 [Luteolibacter sp.]
MSFFITADAQVQRVPANEAIDPFNYVLGTQSIGIRYQFTEQTGLVETAEQIQGMGSNLLKIALNPKYCGADYSLPKRDDIGSLVELAIKEPSFKALLHMPFGYYQLWAYAFSSGSWDDGISEEEKQAEYKEIYDLSKYLLSAYGGTGKTFLLGHWEGDWHLHHNYNGRKPLPDVAFQSMVDWLNIRQKAVEDAKRNVPESDVKLYHYTEVCLVDKAMKGGKSLVNNVLPHTQVDFVSYSAYDILGWGGKKQIQEPQQMRDRIHQALDYIESKLPEKPSISGKRVFIGEYGFAQNRVKSAEVQDVLSLAVATAGIEWGCPYVLYWEMYCNEVKDEEHEGFWLIDNQNRKQPFYFTLQDYYREIRQIAEEFEQENNRPMNEEEFRRNAMHVLQADAG